MIKINLLPQEMVGAKAGPSRAPSAVKPGAVLVAAVLIVIFGIDAALGVYMYVQYGSAASKAEEWATKSQQVQQELEETEVEYNDIKTDIERMNKLISVAESLDPPDRLLWCRKLNMLPSLVPDGVFLTQIIVDENVEEKQTQESMEAQKTWTEKPPNERGERPEPVMVPVIQQELTLYAIAHVPDGTDTQRLQQMISFYNNIQSQGVTLPFDNEEHYFMRGFQGDPRLSRVAGDTMQGREISRFNFTFDTEPKVIR